jgi:hypothetical protein
MVMLPVTELPASTPEKLHPWSTPVAVALRLTLALLSFPLIVTLAPQLPVPDTAAVESVSEESVSVIETGEHDTLGSVTQPLHAPATEKLSVMAGAVVTVDFEQAESIDAAITTATACRIFYSLWFRSCSAR